MPHHFRTLDGSLWKAGRQPVPMTLIDGTKVEGIWGGSATEERLEWWLGTPGNEIAQTDEVAEIAVRDEETKETAWGPAPARARVFFVLEAPRLSKTGESYRIAKLVTTAATPSQIAFFRDTRFALFGTINSDGTINRIPPLDAPPPPPPAQGELF